MMSDWDATYDAVAAANGGLDLEMPSGEFMNRDDCCCRRSSAGKVSEATIDDKVRRILRTAIQFGWLDRDQTDSSIPRFNADGRQVALEARAVGHGAVEERRQPVAVGQGKDQIDCGDRSGRPSGRSRSAVAAERSSHSRRSASCKGVANYLGSGAKVYYAAGVPTLGNGGHDPFHHRSERRQGGSEC